MIDVVDTNINSFAPIAEQTDFVPHSDQPITLTYGQLQNLIKEATAPLLERIEALEERAVCQDEKIATLESQQDRDFEAFADKINEHSAAINTIWKAVKTAAPPKGQRTEARIKKLKETLKARRSGITFKEAEKLLGIRPNQMTKLLSQLDKRCFDIFARSGNKREKVIRLKSFT